MLSSFTDASLLVSVALNVLLAIALVRRTTAPQAAPEGLRTLSDADRGRVQAEMRAGNKIQAIKLYRELTGCGLADGKRAVEALPLD